MNAADILRYGHLTLLSSLGRIPATETGTPGVDGIWSTRQAMAHLASQEGLLVGVLEAILTEGPPPEMAKMGPEMNDALVAERESKSMAEVREEYETAHARVMELVGQIGAAKLCEVGTIPWYGNEYSLDDYLVYAFYGHKREHAAGFNVFSDRLEKGK